VCGIAGVVKFNPRDVVEKECLRRMSEAIRHRGPDGAGVWVAGRVGLGHRRLAILDLAAGGQPMATEDENVWLVYNGEVYNHPILKQDLEARGHSYRTRSDTETILHLYEEMGEACAERLRGMFAFAIWDRRTQQLLLARDRLGIKPLYYAVTGRELIFASEIKAILASGLIRPVFNRQVLPEYLATGFVAGETTFYAGIRKLLPGRTLAWSRRQGLQIRRYWQLPSSTRAEGGDLCRQARALHDRLVEAVQSHLLSDVPVGLFLSGGIDSAGLAALMAPLVTDRVRTFSVGFANPGANELAYARQVAQAIDAEHREVLVSGDEFFERLPRLIWHEDEPIAFPSSVPLYFVSELARQHVKVVLTGEGADELFCGYNRYRVTAWNERLGRTYGRVVPRPARHAVRRLIEALPPRVRRVGRRTFLAVPPDPRRLYFDNFAIFSEQALSALVADANTIRGADPYQAALQYYAQARGTLVDRVSRVDLQTYLVELLMKQDQMSMAASVESRVPYLDHMLVEHVVQLPTCYKLRGWQTKVVLRHALRDLVPREILTRRKMGFPVPVAPWFRGKYRSIVDEFVLGPRASARGCFDPECVRRLAAEHAAGDANHGHRLWLLVNLEIWQRIVVDGEDVTAVMRPTLKRAVA